MSHEESSPTLPEPSPSVAASPGVGGESGTGAGTNASPLPKVRTARDRQGRAYTPAIGARLKVLLVIVLAGVALLGANSVYLSSVTALGWWYPNQKFQTVFYILMVALHLFLGLLLLLPFLAFAGIHLITSWKRPNRSAVRFGIGLLICSIILIVTGFILWREVFPITDPAVRDVSYWLHIVTPLIAILLYVQHRLAGPRIQWGLVRTWSAAVLIFVTAMALSHSVNPLKFSAQGPSEGIAYFQPSESMTKDGMYINANVMMMDDYCLKCHQDSYKGWFHSAHHFSSFNNKAYLTSVRETRDVALKRDGSTRAARWCAGCHDPVPFFSGEFDDPNYDDVNTRSSQAGITCTACHSIIHVNSTRGNGDYTIEEPEHYPFASSTNPVLQWINNTLVRAKPELHKKTFLKDLHKDTNFCSTCHKVHIPYVLNNYKDFLRGQNHHDAFLLSGVSGHGARSFYYPPVAMNKCADCHMTLMPSQDFGAKDFDGDGKREVHDHLFVGANTGLTTFRGRADITKLHEKYLTEKKVRIDIFGLREGGKIDGKLTAPLRPEIPALRPGNTYLVEVVVRTLAVGHLLTQGTVDSNELWVELQARSGDRIIGQSGGLAPDGSLDPYSHTINVYMLDKNGNRIDRRNAQDIFVPLFNKQVPPGAGQVVHFALEIPADVSGPITLDAKVNYRKFDRIYMNYVFGKHRGPDLPITTMAVDQLNLPVADAKTGVPGKAPENPPSPIADVWQRYNDYGIGLFLEGGDSGGQKGELLQAEEMFRKVADLGKVDGWVNLARVFIREGRIEDARKALEAASKHEQPAAPWVIAWLNGQTNVRNGYLDEAIRDFESVLATRDEARKFDFSTDYEVLNALAQTYYVRSKAEPLAGPSRIAFLNKTIQTYLRTLAIDSENVGAHYGLGQAYNDMARIDAPKSPNANANPVAEANAKPDVPREDLIRKYAKQLADGTGDPADRTRIARSLEPLVKDFASGPIPAIGTKMEPLLELTRDVAPVLAAETDPDRRYALSRGLMTVHQTLHTMYRPDESAEGRAFAAARSRNKAADMNAQSIVIHPMHPPGAKFWENLNPQQPPTTAKNPSPAQSPPAKPPMPNGPDAFTTTSASANPAPSGNGKTADATARKTGQETEEH